MAKPVYAWRRFWCPPDGRVNLSDSGFLVDPEDPFGALLNADVVTWDAISSKPCLVLLGEPGIGKSSAMVSERERMAKAVEGTGDLVLSVDLRKYQTDQRLHQHVFESAAMKSWQQGTGRLHMFLDSMDECLMRIDNIGPVLLNELGELPIDRLSARIACRTADWPKGLEHQLRELWGEDHVGVYELAPLRRIDIIEAARVSGISPEASFVENVIRRGVVPLAIKPVTLEFLFNTYRRQGDLPDNQTDLYSEGCRLLCEEPREGLRPARPATELTAGQRLAVASRIAATTMFCARDAIWTDVDRGDVPSEDIRVSEMLGPVATYGPFRVQVDEDSIWQALNTGLFSSRGPSRIGSAHQTYSEFLAARFLIENNVSADRIMSLLVHPDGKIIPQLRETAGWLASMMPEVFRKIMAVDAEALLFSDAATVDAQERTDLVESLLGLFDQGRLLDFDWDARRRYRKLNHPSLSDQLRPYIRNKQKGTVVRRVAITMAEACEVRSLDRDLIDVSLDQTDVHELRVAAAFALSQWRSAEAAQALRPLAVGAAGDDPDDDLRGCGLSCAWPSSLSAVELFAALTRPKKPNRYGLYDSFLRRPIADQLRVADLPIALAWVESEDECGDSLSPFARIADEIRAVALKHLDEPSVAQAVAAATWKWIKTDGLHPSHEKAFRDALVANVERRRVLVRDMIRLNSGNADSAFYLVHGRLLGAGDFAWVLERFDDVDAALQAPLLVELAKRMFDDRDAECGDSLRNAARRHPILADEFRWFLEPESEEAQRVRENRARLEALSQPTAKPVLDPSPQKRIAAALTEFESGELDAFWKLSQELTLEADSTHYGDWREPSIIVMPGWKSADSETKSRIVRAAKEYLNRHVPPAADCWVKSGSIPYASLAGYRALLLVLHQEPTFVVALSAALWGKWAAVTLVYPTADDAFEKAGPELLRSAYRVVPDTILDTLRDLIDRENKEHGVLFVLQRTAPIWDDRLADFLLEKSGDQKLKAGAFGRILEELLQRGAPQARAIAGSALRVIPVEDGEGRQRAVVAAQALIRTADDAGWSVVWPAAQKDVQFGLQVFADIGSIFGERASSTFKRLTDDELTDLYIWLATNVPYADERDDGGFGAVSPDRALAMWRDSLLNYLKLRGTQGSSAGLRRAVQALPQYPWLVWHLMEAEQVTRFRTWTPLKPEHLFAFAAAPESRLVQNGEQLLGVLVESLDRLRREIQGVTPATFVLWNEVSKDVFRPKEEGRISDYVKLHFERDIKARGIISNREVEIWKGAGSSPGEETDIHLDALTQLPNGTYDRISAIVEVKGCWNRELMDGMERQLVGRYLKDNACPFGLYLVGWFLCDQWDGADYRRKQTPQMAADQANAHFEKQAVDISDATRLIRAFVLDATLS